jgi:amino acid transporter
MWLCGASSITSMARMWYAFARDDGMPGSSLIKRVSPTYRTPVWSILVTSALAVVLCLYASAYFVITSIWRTCSRSISTGATGGGGRDSIPRRPRRP